MAEDKKEGAQAEQQAQTPATISADALIAVNSALVGVQDELKAYRDFFAAFGGPDKVAEKLRGFEEHAQAMAANAAREKESLIAGLVANSRCVFKQEELTQWSIDQLSKLSRSIQPVDYTGRSPFAVNQAAQASIELEQLEMPAEAK